MRALRASPSRIERCWRPYHAALAAALDAAAAGGGPRWHLNVHSMPDDSYRRLGLPDKPLADFVLGDLDGRTAGEPVMALIERVLREQGYSVARNDPFKGVEIIARNGRLRVIRDSRVIGEYGIDSLKREKDDAREVRDGLECGIKVAGFNDLKEGDILECYRIEEVARTLS